MKNISYEANGKTTVIKVSNEFAHTYEKMESDAQREIWRLKKRNESSFETMCEAGFQFEDPTANIEENFLQEELCSELKNAIGKLLPQQQELIRRIYYNNESQSQIAKEYGIERSTLHNRLERALKKLKNFLD